MKGVVKYIVAAICICTLAYAEAKPKVWIYTDMSDRNIPGNNHEGTVNDPDDISAMAAYLMLSNRFETLGISVTSTHRKEHKTSPNQGEWASKYFGDAYAKDIVRLNEKIGGYQPSIPFMESCLKSTMERFNPDKSYSDLKKYNTVEALFDKATQTTDTIFVLCWGALTEPAILVKHCIEAGRGDILDRVKFISHWSNSSLHQGTPEMPDKVANCRDDYKACGYLKDMAAKGLISFYECGAIGQHGAVSGSPKGEEHYLQFHKSELGKIFATGKFVFKCVDFSDAATYIVLAGEWGVTLDDINPDGTNPAEKELANEKALKQNAHKLNSELLRISNIAASIE